MKQVLLIGGPNGAGKTTEALTLLPQYLPIYEFVNADAIARGLNLLNPSGQKMEAGRLMLARMQQLMRDGKSFAFETTCAGRNHVAVLQHCRRLGYEVIVIFLWLPSPEMAIRRVAQRVITGGHDIPVSDIRRRYARGLRNLITLYLPLADRATIYDNSDNVPGRTLKMIAEKKTGEQIVVHEQGIWGHMREYSNGN